MTAPNTTEEEKRMKPNVGDQVGVFNLVGPNFVAEVVKINKQSVTVKTSRLVFTNQKDARPPLDDGLHYYVPYHDIINKDHVL